MMSMDPAIQHDASELFGATFSHDRRSSTSPLDRNPDDLSAARFDGVPSDDLIGGPVGALHEHVRLHRA